MSYELNYKENSNLLDYITMPNTSSKLYHNIMVQSLGEKAYSQDGNSKEYLYGKTVPDRLLESAEFLFIETAGRKIKEVVESVNVVDDAISLAKGFFDIWFTDIISKAISYNIDIARSILPY